MIVPSISEITTRSFESQTNIRAVAAIAPEADKEKVMAFAPGLRLRDFWTVKIDQLKVTNESNTAYQLI